VTGERASAEAADEDREERGGRDGRAAERGEAEERRCKQTTIYKASEAPASPPYRGGFPLLSPL